jgi:hypothetical protein
MAPERLSTVSEHPQGDQVRQVNGDDVTGHDQGDYAPSPDYELSPAPLSQMLLLGHSRCSDCQR